LSDLRLLTDAAPLLGDGPIASIPTAGRAVELLALDGEDGLAKLRLARAVARASAWQAGAGPTGRLVVDLDATLVVAHTDRNQGASGTYTHTFGFHPMLAYLDHGNGRGEPLAAILRTGSAGANDAADHIALLDLALAQLPPPRPAAGVDDRWSAPTAPAPPPRSFWLGARKAEASGSRPPAQGGRVSVGGQELSTPVAANRLGRATARPVGQPWASPSCV
jgi:Transposase DDE domain group 1